MSEKSSSFGVVLKIGVVVALLAAGVVFALNSVRPIAVVEAVKRDKAVDAVAGSVEVRAEGEIFSLRSEVGGVVESVSNAFRPGGQFKEKEILLQLDTSELERQIEELKRQQKFASEKREIVRKNNSEHEAAQTAFENAKRFLKLGDISLEQYKQAERTFNDVRMKLDLADYEFRKSESDFERDLREKQLVLEKMSIRAPFDGIVSDVFKLKGSLVGGGEPVATIFSLGRNVVAQVSEDDIGKVQLGQKAKVRLISYPGQEFDAKVDKILPMADAETRRYKVFLKVELEPEKLIPYATGEVTITIGERENQTVIPRRALLFGGRQVFVVKNGRVEKRDVEVGYLALNQAEILKGLAEGELVITEQLDQFRDGQRVRMGGD